MTIFDGKFDAVVINPVRHQDARGYFAETFKDARFRDHVADIAFVQDNESLSVAPLTLRGLHFQRPPFAQAKLVRCVAGAIFDVAVDIRVGSPTYGQYIGVELSAENGRQLYVPVGFAHGFLTLQPNSLVQYKVSAPYSAEHDGGIAWNDPTIGIDWPLSGGQPVLSDKDRALPRLAALPAPFHVHHSAGEQA